MQLYCHTEGNEPEILLIHGILSDHCFFDMLVSQLKDSYRLIAYDRRGYGVSSAGANPDYSVAVQAAEAAEIIKEHAAEPVYIIGHSAGGLIGLELALQFPELVQKLILIETPIALTEADQANMAVWNAELNQYAARKNYVKAIPAFYKRIGEPAASGRKQGANRDFKRTFQNLNNFMTGELNEIQQHPFDLPALQKLSVPVTMFLTTAKPDSIFTLTAQHTAALAGWETLTIDGNHNIVEQKPEEFIKKIKNII